MSNLENKFHLHIEDILCYAYIHTYMYVMISTIPASIPPPDSMTRIHAKFHMMIGGGFTG